MRHLPLLLVLAACVPEPARVDADAAADQDVAPPDAALPDSGAPEDSGAPPDAGEDAGAEPADAGLPSHCPSGVNPTCDSSAACGADMPAPTNCATCVPSNLSLCVEEDCLTPPTLELSDIYSLTTQVNPTIPVLESIAGFAIAARTAGERLVTCADVYAGVIDFSDRCYNVLESKSINVSQSGDTYGFSFNGFASGQRTLFVLYGHTSTGARGPPVGISCTEIDVGPPVGGQTLFFAADPMRPI